MVGAGGLGALFGAPGERAGASGTPPPTGSVRGIVRDLEGVPQAHVGRLCLMYPSGRHAGVPVSSDAGGRFAIDALPAGDYQVRLHGCGDAIIPEWHPHPIRFTVQAGRVTDLAVPVVRGRFGTDLVEIHCGDDFFQRQPDGRENGEAVVRLGTVVCWYNVGLQVHSVTGGPWHDSGDLQKDQSYIWVANQAGLFSYYCRYDRPQMQATLRVTA